MRKWIAAATVFLGATTLASATELAVLQNGFTIRHERHEVQGATTRLYTSAKAEDFIEVPTAQIVSYTPDETPAPAASAEQPRIFNVHAVIKDAGSRHGLDPDFIASVVHAESGYNVKALSPKGAQGLMQLMPKTAADLGVKDSFDPEANIEAGTKYLRALLDQYNGDVVKALAAYNAGVQRVAQYHGLPPFRETQAYVRRIVIEYNRKKAEQRKAAAKTQALAKQPTLPASSQ